LNSEYLLQIILQTLLTIFFVLAMIVCGTCAVDVAGVENFDVSDLVSGHQDYCLITGDILKRVRLNQPFRHDMMNPSELLDASEGQTD
jgi:Protein of unknown function (DUF726)